MAIISAIMRTKKCAFNDFVNNNIPFTPPFLIKHWESHKINPFNFHMRLLMDALNKLIGMPLHYPQVAIFII